MSEQHAPMNIAELGRGLEPSLRRALVRVASVETLLVACDYDGTLAPIVDDPAEALSLIHISEPTRPY